MDNCTNINFLKLEEKNQLDFKRQPEPPPIRRDDNPIEYWQDWFKIVPLNISEERVPPTSGQYPL